MKRKSIFGILFVVLLIVGLVIYLEACKKELVTPINNTYSLNNDFPDYTAEARNIVGKIKKFKSQLVETESGVRNELYMPIDSVIWSVEALFNSEYAFPDRNYLETTKQELQFFVDINSNEEVLVTQVADLYEDITNAVRLAYSDDGIFEDKSLMAVVVDKGETDENRVELKVYVVSGRVNNTVSVNDPDEGPFVPGDCWYYGELGGSCDDPTLLEDAAEIIEDAINYYHGGSSVPQIGYRYLNHGMFRVALDGNEYEDEYGDPLLYFYEANGYAPLYLDYEMLNYYYLRELKVLLQMLPSDPRIQSLMPITPTFVEVDIQGQLGYVGNGNYFHHKNYVVYGSKALIPEQELPPVRDLLNQ